LVTITHEELYKLFEEIVEKILNEETLKKIIQTDGRYFSLNELEQSKFIQGDESIEDIDKKIRAFWNPPHSGAQIKLRGKKYTIINEEILEWIARKI